MYKAIIILMYIICTIRSTSINCGGQLCELSLKYTINKTAALPNPFKGFVPYSSASLQQINGFPTSMQNLYFPMKDLMMDKTTFNFASIENTLNLISSRKNQAIIRVFADYPNYPNGPIFIPNYLKNVSFCNYTFYGGGSSPDYQNPDLIEAMVLLIKQLAKSYDGDSRIAVLQTGFLGHWGQQHTQQPCQYASLQTQTTIFNAFKQNFNKTKLMVRYPDVIGNIKTPNLKMGYHDDSFTQDTLRGSSWFFLQRMIRANATNQWKLYPIGGETRPQFWTCIFGQNITQSCADQTKKDPSLVPQDINQCINTLHFSWAWNMGLYQNIQALKKDGSYNRALQAAGNMGYAFVIQETKTILFNQGIWYLNVTAYINNSGVAPFYYDLSGMVGVNGQLYLLNQDKSFSNLLPGEQIFLSRYRIPVNPPIRQIYLSLVSQDTPLKIKFAVNQVEWDEKLYIDGLNHKKKDQYYMKMVYLIILILIIQI